MDNIKSIEKNIDNLVLLIDKIKTNSLYNKKKIQYETIISILKDDIKELKNSIDN